MARSQGQSDLDKEDGGEDLSSRDVRLLLWFLTDCISAGFSIHLKLRCDLSDGSSLCKHLKSFYTRLKPVKSTINTLGNVLYKVFCSSKDEARNEMSEALLQLSEPSKHAQADQLRYFGDGIKVNDGASEDTCEA
ncbi:hypothetical protein N665_0566s0013 [Sinapis alba]|nr:hypothetical protein N665_0566s0012 [Sinapis alba]KAF8087806.1 hypothetical protein N665_0566s0013 [Sinapis alba]